MGASRMPTCPVVGEISSIVPLTDARHSVGAVGDGSRARAGDADLAHQRDAALYKRVLFLGKFRVLVQSFHERLRIAAADERHAQHPESFGPHIGGAVGDVEVHAMNHCHHSDQSGGGEDHSEQRQKAAKLARRQRVPRHRRRFEK